MNIRTARWSMVVLVLALQALTVAAEEYEEYDEAPVAPAKPLRPSPLLRQARGPIIGRPAPKNTATQKTTTTEAPEPVYDDEEVEEELAEEQPTTTTEAPKRAGLKTGVVRPFRSNADLIETLKRRRQQHQSGGNSPSSTTSTAAPTTSEKGFKSGRRGPSGNKISNSAVDQTGSNSERKSTVNGRRFNPRGSKVTEAPAEAEEVEEQPTRPRGLGRGRRF